MRMASDASSLKLINVSLAEFAGSASIVSELLPPETLRNLPETWLSASRISKLLLLCTVKPSAVTTPEISTPEDVVASFRALS